ncbi:MAG: alanine racemase, partial [Prosthecobacter sp.]
MNALLPYTPPTITRHLHGANSAVNRNRNAHGLNHNVCERIDGVAVADLAARFGSPLFVFSERTLREKIRRAREAFESRYPNTRFAWSYKTNYLNAICRVFHSEGSIAEVVSEFEYEKARRNGIAGRDIIFNGPHKSREGLELAVAEGAMIQVDNWDELLLLDSIAKEQNRSIGLAIRCWLDAGIQPVWSKFGFGVENGEAWRAIRRIAESKGRLRLQGLHTHIGTYILEPNAYKVAAEKLVTLMERCRETYGWQLRYLNLGGGFPSLSTLHYSYQSAEQF